jgi:hypothetical protein
MPKSRQPEESRAIVSTASRTKIARCSIGELLEVMLPQFEELDWQHINVSETESKMSAVLEEVWTSGTEIITVTYRADVIWAERETGVLELVLTVSDDANKWTKEQCDAKADELMAAINDEFAARWHPYRNLIRPAQIQQSS